MRVLQRKLPTGMPISAMYSLSGLPKHQTTRTRITACFLTRVLATVRLYTQALGRGMAKGLGKCGHRHSINLSCRFIWLFYACSMYVSMQGTDMILLFHQGVVQHDHI